MAQDLPPEQAHTGGAQALLLEVSEIVPQVVDIKVSPPQGQGDGEVAHNAVGEHLPHQRGQTAHSGQGARPEEGDEQQELDLQPHPPGEPGDGPVGPHLVTVPHNGQGGEGDTRQGRKKQEAEKEGTVLSERTDQGGERRRAGCGRVLGRGQRDGHTGRIREGEGGELTGDVAAVLDGSHLLPVVGDQKIIPVGQPVGRQGVGVGEPQHSIRPDAVEQAVVPALQGIFLLRGIGGGGQLIEPILDKAVKAVRSLVVGPEYVAPGDVERTPAGNGHNHSRRCAVDQQRDAQNEGQKGQGGLNASRFCIQCPTPPSDIPVPLD